MLFRSDDDGTMKPILTYKFEVRGGVGAVVRGTGLGIDVSEDSVVVVYDVEPYAGIKIEPSPYSDKIVVHKGNSDRLASSCRCYVGWSN